MTPAPESQRVLLSTIATLLLALLVWGIVAWRSAPPPPPKVELPAR